MDLILYAIPFFFLLILLEFAYGMVRGRNTYRINDTINSLSMGSLSRLQALVILGFSGAIYEWVVAHYQLQQLPGDQAWVWVSCFVLYDFAYYWKHRFGHEVALFWGSHVAHHQSEDFNLGTALRQTSIDFYGFLFYLPFFALGYPAEILFTVVSLNLIYQFWVHTEHVPKLGPLEWIMVTPSNHRVHHGRNRIYVDKNYGGVFIVWDRLFGTFQDELDDEPVSFGLRKPLNSWNPLWANVHVYWRLILDTLNAPGLINKLRLPFKPPGWRPAGTVTRCKQKALEQDLSLKFDPQVSSFARIYTFVQFLVTVGLSLYILLNAAALSYTVVSSVVLFLTFSLFVHGRWMEGREDAVYLEVLRLLLLPAGIQLLTTAPLALVIAAAYAFCSLALVLWNRQAGRLEAVHEGNSVLQAGAPDSTEAQHKQAGVP